MQPNSSSNQYAALPFYVAPMDTRGGYDSRFAAPSQGRQAQVVQGYQQSGKKVEQDEPGSPELSLDTSSSSSELKVAEDRVVNFMSFRPAIPLFPATRNWSYFNVRRRASESAKALASKSRRRRRDAPHSSKASGSNTLIDAPKELVQKPKGESSQTNDGGVVQEQVPQTPGSRTTSSSAHDPSKRDATILPSTSGYPGTPQLPHYQYPNGMSYAPATYYQYTQPPLHYAMVDFPLPQSASNYNGYVAQKQGYQNNQTPQLYPTALHPSHSPVNAGVPAEWDQYAPLGYPPHHYPAISNQFQLDGIYPSPQGPPIEPYLPPPPPNAICMPSRKGYPVTRRPRASPFPVALEEKTEAAVAKTPIKECTLTTKETAVQGRDLLTIMMTSSLLAFMCTTFCTKSDECLFGALGTLKDKVQQPEKICLENAEKVKESEDKGLVDETETFSQDDVKVPMYSSGKNPIKKITIINYNIDGKGESEGAPRDVPNDPTVDLETDNIKNMEHRKAPTGSILRRKSTASPGRTSSSTKQEEDKISSGPAPEEKSRDEDMLADKSSAYVARKDTQRKLLEKCQHRLCKLYKDNFRSHSRHSSLDRRSSGTATRTDSSESKLGQGLRSPSPGPKAEKRVKLSKQVDTQSGNQNVGDKEARSDDPCKMCAGLGWKASIVKPKSKGKDCELCNDPSPFLDACHIILPCNHPICLDCLNATK